MRTNDQEGTIMLSKRLDAIKGWDVVAKAEEDGTVLTGVVTEVIKGGVIAVTNGVEYLFLLLKQLLHVANHWRTC